ncbi:uncharacterized protein C8Q71DRAFT_854647 [Rhodofomes roseus]|uniref:Uncharacterized protein n=1 Tax=Rhodofomes roseus TaxID=34475 RepID=A0A4Y9XXI0_9APHY|nr:uncharacterized protein C8Q71DRAFT_854647 [Rhodofomes roseus]KAH9840779.1 hypothetical protein C8Q71DRAFT_854647 [Rhodofomes roseus]TFY54856.1 hypothetical protein EVJ58_g8611 [Rhodofomes roseus]
MFAFIALPVALAAGSFAMPAALSARQDPCTALGAGAASTLSYNFQLEVVDPSAAEGATGTVLALVNGDSTTGNWWLKEIHQNSTGDFSSWTLNGGALIPTPSSSNADTVGSDMAVNAGDALEFAVTTKGAANAAAGQTPYCAVSNADGHATLTVNSVSDEFFVCQASTSEYVLAFSPSASSSVYDYSTCTKQLVHLVPA